MGAFNVKLGKRLREIRQARGLSQEQIAKILGLNRSTVSQIENGKRSLAADELSSVSDALGISIDSLLDPDKEIDVVLEEESVRREKGRLRINVPEKNVMKFKEVLLYLF